jgi:hypothetical protein
MKRLTHRLVDIDPILYLLNDDGFSTTTVVIHGANVSDAFATRPDPDEYRCLISRAQLTGCVYLLSWRSGDSPLSQLSRARVRAEKSGATEQGSNIRGSRPFPARKCLAVS